MIEYKVFQPKEISFDKLYDFIKESDKLFIPTLSSLVELKEYTEKIYNNATCFVYLNDEDIIALSIAYVNKAPKETYGTYLAVKPEFEADGLGLDLVRKSISYAKEFGSSGFSLQIRSSNTMLLKFYLHQGFTIIKEGLYPNSDIKELDLNKKF